MRSVGGAAVFAVVLASPVMAQGTVVIGAGYRCDDNRDLPVLFLNGIQPAQMAIVWVEDRMVAMRQVTSGSGFRYRSLDADRPLILRGKGNAVTLYLGEDETQTVLTGCETVE